MAIKMRATNKKAWGVKVTLPDGLGVHAPSKEDGTFEVDEELHHHAKNLVKDHNGLYEFVSDKKAEVKQTKTPPPPPTKQAAPAAKANEGVTELGKKSEDDELNQGQGNELGSTDEDELNKGTGEEGGDEVIDENAQTFDADETTGDEEEQQYRDALSGKTRKELEALCKEFPGGEWRPLDKEGLVEYLIGKMKK